MKTIFDKINSHLQAGLPFAVYSKPGSDVAAGIFQKDNTTYHTGDLAEAGFVFAPFKGDKRLFIPNRNAEVTTAIIKNDGYTLAEAAPPEVDNAEKEQFETLVAKSVAAIRSGRFEKLVGSRKEKAPLKDTDVTHILKNLLFAYPRAFCYCFYHPEAGLWMGATPEQLLKADGDAISTVALAGTQLYREGEEAVWPEKERQEQQYVTDFILEELHDLVTDVKATEPYTFKAGNIVHIKTNITANLNNSVTLKDVVETLHPTPAVCGLPKADAMQFIIENEGYDREYYSGFLGELNYDATSGKEGRTDLFVNLRCMKITGGEAELFIGCGITKDSDPEKEFIETVNKSMTMRRVLAP